jgi:hypothetical protein
MRDSHQNESSLDDQFRTGQDRRRVYVSFSTYGGVRDDIQRAPLVEGTL